MLFATVSTAVPRMFVPQYINCGAVLRTVPDTIEQLSLGMHRESGRIHPTFFIFGIRNDSGYGKPDIRLDIRSNFLSSRKSKIGVVQLGKQKVSLGKFKRCIFYIYIYIIFLYLSCLKMQECHLKKLKRRKHRLLLCREINRISDHNGYHESGF